MASDKFYPTPLPQLLNIIFRQLDRKQAVFGIPKVLFFEPQTKDAFRSKRYGQLLETPIGVAAGPHTQLSQNIVAAWLTGARFIELKTVQTLDELEVSKPCIDMQDEGYNCEWSQELKIKQSFEQYLDAWIMIHVLKDHFLGSNKERGFIFNMSVGYDMAGILNDNMQWFLKKMQDATAELEEKIKTLESIYPRIRELRISPNLSDNVTLSTMHGCPPQEIEQIGNYLLTEKKLHTTIKLNPTLLGKERLNDILKKSGFATVVPDQAFAHDLKYEDALKILSRLEKTASENKLQFGVKLTNTLESVNHKQVFPPKEKMMYMSGRALHPIAVNLAGKLQHEFNGRLSISFSGGANAFNISHLISCGLEPVTICSDLLKPGGYGRLNQYIEELRKDFALVKSESTEDFIIKKADNQRLSLNEAILLNLEKYSNEVFQDEAYRKTGLREPNIKTERPLGWFDCIHAPCEDTCPTHQDIPAYNYHTSKAEFKKAAEVIRQTNPFPQITGMICDHLCQLKCTRINYEHAVLIREIKRFVAEKASLESSSDHPRTHITGGKKVAIIGAGPSGLSCATFLARAGFGVEVFETKKRPGGMVSSGIPSFRLTENAIKNDVKSIEELGVKIHYERKISRESFERMQHDFDYIYIASGAQRSAKLNIEGVEAEGVMDPLLFLEELKENKKPVLGSKVVIIGGGNTAMDVARTAWRLVGEEGKVTVVYRRTIREMPADQGEIKAVLAEGMKIVELAAPLRMNAENGHIASLTCIRMKLGEADAGGRPRPVEIPGSEFEIEADTIIPAVGQELDIDFCDHNLLRTSQGSYETMIPRVFIGGDAMRGASTAINAIGDGRKAAQEIIEREKIAFSTKPENIRMPQDHSWHMTQRARRLKPAAVKELPTGERKNFKLVSSTISEEEASYEASRCLLCDEICNICVTVCPNLACYGYETEPATFSLHKLVAGNNGWVVEAHKEFKMAQQYQILHIADWCNNCGNCTTFCPSAGEPYKDKPHFFINKEAFQADFEITGFEIQETPKDSIDTEPAARMYIILLAAQTLLD
jgi:putative selenate reductase